MRGIDVETTTVDGVMDVSVAVVTGWDGIGDVVAGFGIEVRVVSG